ncbi:cytochrome P450 [Kitasatospora sp. NPDC089509]|uniref:cytochrome P450 n=1 Tax=Kitasatospora sp. NPDC089509 TaxID=3364079 RepID=UPI0037FBBF19
MTAPEPPPAPGCPIAHGGAPYGTPGLYGTPGPYGGGPVPYCGAPGQYGGGEQTPHGGGLPTGVPLTPLYGPAVAEDPHGLYARLRERYGPVAPIELEPGVEAWLVIGYPELLELTRNEALFSKDSRHWRVPAEGRLAADSRLKPMTAWRPTLLNLDGAEHQRLRTAVSDTLAQIDHRQLRETTEAAANGLIDSWGPDGTADLIGQYARALPLLVSTQLVGLPIGSGPRVIELISAFVDSGPESVRAAGEFQTTLADLVRRRRTGPDADLTSWLLAHPAGLTDEEAAHHLVVMMVAGNETCINWIGNTLRLLLTDRRFRATLTGGRLTVSDALEEVLWRDPPTQNFPGRWATGDTVLGGQYINAGDMLVLGLAAANADPAAQGAAAAAHGSLGGNRAHLAWGAGKHVCPAQHPARIIVETAVETLLHRLPDLQLAVPPGELNWRPSPWSRALVTLPVLYSAFTPPRPPAPERPAWTPPTTTAATDPSPYTSGPSTPGSSTPGPSGPSGPNPSGPNPSGSTPSGATSTGRTPDSGRPVPRSWWNSLAGWWSGR